MVNQDEVPVAVASKGTGRPLVVLPGAFGLETRPEVLANLEDRFQVVKFVHPGYSGTLRPAWCDTARDLAYLYIDKIEQMKLDDVALLGCSFGGWVAAEIAIHRPHWLSALVLVDSFGIRVGGRTDRTIADLFAVNFATLRELSFENPAIAERYLGTEGATESHLIELARAQEALAAYGWKPYMHDPKLQRRLSRITVPTLVIWGANDRITDRANGEAMARAMPGSRMMVVPGASHHPHLEKTEDFERVMFSFLAGHQKEILTELEVA